jgi:lysozyme family protein
VKFFYAKFLPDGGVTTLQMEFLRWQQYWRRQTTDTAKPQTAVESLQVAVGLGTYPAISAMLQIFATLPVTTATGERSFSALKYLKNYLRSTMTEDRLNGLAHLYINRDIELEYGKVIEEFGTSVTKSCGYNANFSVMRFLELVIT